MVHAQADGVGVDRHLAVAGVSHQGYASLGRQADRFAGRGGARGDDFTAHPNGFLQHFGADSTRGQQ